MKRRIALEVAVPERQVVSEAAGAVQLPLADGYKGVLPGHAPMMAEAGVGVLTYTTGEAENRLALNGGVVEILPDRVRVLAATAELAAEIDLERARKALERADKRLRPESPAIDVERAGKAAARARARLAAAAPRPSAD